MGTCAARLRTPARVFLHAFWVKDKRSDEGEGVHRHTLTPSPQGCNHHRNILHARPNSIQHIFLNSPGPSVFLHPFWAKDKRSDEGEGGTAHITHSPNARFNITKLIKSPMLAAGSQPRPPHVRQLPPPRFLCSVISECLFEVHYEVCC